MRISIEIDITTEELAALGKIPASGNAKDDVALARLILKLQDAVSYQGEQILEDLIPGLASAQDARRRVGIALGIPKGPQRPDGGPIQAPNPYYIPSSRSAGFL